MKLALQLGMTLAGVGVVTSIAVGHGTPIHVTVDVDRLVVSQGLSDAVGFAPEIFAEDDEDGDPIGSVNLPQIGQATLWQVPGMDIYGMDAESSLSIEVLPRPVIDENATERRVLWYWNPQTQLPSAAPPNAAFHLLARENRSLTLTPDDMTPPEPLLIADSLAWESGFHNHSLLNFALRDQPAPPAGAYGFFARLTSDQYAASNPFLVAFNYGADYGDMFTAAMAINAAAFLPGDYDRNDVVDVLDYDEWKSNYGQNVALFLIADGNGDGFIQAADYTVWRNNLGATVGGGASAGPSAPVPEPATVSVAAAFLLMLAFPRWRRRKPAQN